MTRIIFFKESGSENFFRNAALDLVINAGTEEKARHIAKLITEGAGLSTEDQVEFMSWLETFLVLIQATAQSSN